MRVAVLGPPALPSTAPSARALKGTVLLIDRLDIVGRKHDQCALPALNDSKTGPTLLAVCLYATTNFAAASLMISSQDIA